MSRWVICVAGLILSTMFVGCIKIGDCVADRRLARWELQPNSFGKVIDRDQGKYLVRFCDEKENCEKRTLPESDLMSGYYKIECQPFEELKKQRGKE